MDNEKLKKIGGFTDAELSDPQNKMVIAVLTALANKVDTIKGRKGAGKGIIVQDKNNEDRVGIAFHKGQKWSKEKKLFVYWNDEKMPTLKNVEELTQIGFSD